MQSSSQNQLITIFGGSGFLGRHTVRALAKRGYRIRVAVRRPDLAGHLQPLGLPGQIQPVQANIRYPESIKTAIKGAQTTINLTGILYKSGAQTFESIHVEGAAAIAQAAEAEGSRLIHLSAIGADETSSSHYARTKAQGEKEVWSMNKKSIIFRPSIVFGPEDDFFNLFASLARILPFLPLIGGGHTKFQPVFVGDVAEAIAKAVDGEAKGGTLYECGGPSIKTFKELLTYILQQTGRNKPLIPLPFWLASLQAQILQIMPKPLLTPDQVTLLKTDNIVSSQAIKQGRTLEGLGITPTTIESIVPSYLWRFRKSGQFSPIPKAQ